MTHSSHRHLSNVSESHETSSHFEHGHEDSHLPHSHDDLIEHQHDHGHDTIVIWRGVVVLSVLVVFFIVERLLNIFGEWRQRLQSTKEVNQLSNTCFCFLQIINNCSLQFIDRLIKSLICFPGRAKWWVRSFAVTINTVTKVIKIIKSIV